MGTKNRPDSADLKRALLEKGNSFSFFQVIRVLRQLSQSKNIKVRPNLSLSSQTSTVKNITEVDSKFTVTSNILGLYGTGSPLPTFYTEELMEEKGRDKSCVRDFLDIINNRLYELLFEGWAKYKNLLQVIEEKNPDHIERLYSLIGLGQKELRQDLDDPYSLLRYAGLFTQSSKSASGLQTVLCDAFEGIKIEILSCLKRKATAPREQACFLGLKNNSLGENIYVGNEIIDRNKFRICVGPLTEDNFRRFLPGTNNYRRLISLTKFYITDPFEFDVEAVLKEKQAKNICLGKEKWSQLGLDTWIFSTKDFGQTSSIYYPEYSR